MQLGHTLKLILLSFTLSLTFSVFADSAKQVEHIKINNTVKSFIKTVSKKDHFNQQQLLKWFHQAQYYSSIIAAMKRPYEKQPWNFYQAHFVNQKFILPGAVYWQCHTKILKEVQKRYGVDPSIIVAIIGIESHYGLAPGSYQEIGALSTLAFNYPPRKKFFQKELAQYLILARKQHLPLLKLKGSYAGALGIPQFMPSSYIYYGVAIPPSRKVDLIHNDADAIASIANYLKKAHWQQGEPIAFEVKKSDEVPEKLVVSNGSVRYTKQQLQKRGITTYKPIKTTKKLSIIELNNSHGPEFWITTANFRAILRYNTSVNYAMAVFQLSQAIRKEYEQRTH